MDPMKTMQMSRTSVRSTLMLDACPGILWGWLYLLLVASVVWTVGAMANNDDDIAFSIQGPDTLATHEQASYALTAFGVDFRDISNVTWSVFGPAAEIASTSENVATVLAKDVPGDVTLSATFSFRPFGEQLGATYTLSRRMTVEDKLGVRVILDPPGPVTLLPGQELHVTAVVENSMGNDAFSFFWNYGDGERGSQEVNEPRLTMPAHAYEQPGSYIVSVDVIDAFGAEGSAQLAVNVYENALEVAIGGPSRVPAGMRQAFLLQVRGGTPGYTCAWNVIPAAQLETTSDPCQGAFVTFPDAFGEHLVFATVTDAVGTSTTAEHRVQVTSDAPLTIGLAANPQAVNVGRPVTATATPGGGIVDIDGMPGTYRVFINWGDGAVSAENVQPGAALTATHFYAEPGQYLVLATAFDAVGGSSVSQNVFINVGIGEAHWKLTNVVGNPDSGPLSEDTPRLSSACTLGGTVLSIAHSRRFSDTTTVDVTFTFSYAPLPKAVVVGERIEVPITLRVAGEHISENAGASAGFTGYPDSLSVVSCSLVGCPGNSEAMPVQTGTSRILFPGIPSEPSRTFALQASLSDTTSGSANCKTQYIYAFVPVNP